jgi:uncharacterized repeat protein (TIGR03803 family)
MSPLLEASDGKLYGTTYAGGTSNNAGTVYRLNKDGSGFEFLRAFNGVGGDGRHPSGRLVEGADGALYGTTERGGTNGWGTLFSLNKNGGGFAVLAVFGDALGKYPRGGLVIGPDGGFFGTTDQGGAMGFGTIFRYGPPIEEITGLSFNGAQPSLTCMGLPGTNYYVERTAQLGPAAAWSVVSSTNAPASGGFEVIDESAPSAGAFYRLRR